MNEQIKNDLYEVMTKACDAVYADEKNAVAIYDAQLKNVVAMFRGEENTPAHFDPDKFECFHNCYKSDFGFRPRGERSLASMNAWLNDRPEFGYGQHDDDEEIVAAPVADYTAPHTGEPLLKSWLYDLI